MAVGGKLQVEITMVPVIDAHPEECAILIMDQLRGFNPTAMSIIIHPIQNTARQIANAQVLNTVPIAVTILTAILTSVIAPFIMPFRSV